MTTRNGLRTLVLITVLSFIAAPLFAGEAEEWIAPTLPDGAAVVTDTSPLFITPPASLKPQPAEGGYSVAKEAPTVDFMYFPGQTHRGTPWSAWGEGTVHDGKYYCSIGDHHFTCYVYEYDPKTKTMKTILELSKFLDLPDDHYKPGKIHSRLAVDKDGWLYFSTHDGGNALPAQYKYQGDWIGRHNVNTGATEILSHGPIGLASMPTGFTDTERGLIYTGSEEFLRFFVFDVKTKKVTYQSADDQGPTRCMLHSQTTGRVYYRKQKAEKMWRYDPKTNTAVQIECPIDPRAATRETPQGIVYAIDWNGDLWAFNVKTEKSVKVDHACIGAQKYTTSIDVDKAGRYLYYTPGAHGGSETEGTPVIQYDLKTHHKKVIAFLQPLYEGKYSYAPRGTYSMRLSDDDSMLFTTWMGNRKGIKAADFDVCSMTVIHIPESERQ